MASDLRPQMHPRRIVAFVDEDGVYDHVRRAAVRLAREHGATLILYDSSSGSPFSEPVASEVSAEGVEEQYGSTLDPEDLEKLGRHRVAEQVRAARNEGVEAAGRLASGHGVEPLIAYAQGSGADLVLLPAELEEPSLVERLRGETVEDAEEAAEEDATPIEVAIVDADGGLRPVT